MVNEGCPVLWGGLLQARTLQEYMDLPLTISSLLIIPLMPKCISTGKPEGVMHSNSSLHLRCLLGPGWLASSGATLLVTSTLLCLSSGSEYTGAPTISASMSIWYLVSNLSRATDILPQLDWQCLMPTSWSQVHIWISLKPCETNRQVKWRVNN